MRPLWQVADFFRGVRRELRFGELSRAPLKLLRFELHNDVAECDWISRPADEWDATLSSSVRNHNESLQSLEDAIAIRAMLLDAIPEVQSATLRAFRQPAREPPELVILGAVSRGAPDVQNVGSLVMRAKLYGFCFCFEDGFLRPLQQDEEQSYEFITQSVTRPGQGGISNGSK